MRKSDLDLRGYSSGQFKTFCPNCHKDRRHQSDPSLSLNLDTGGYRCHHCGIEGYLEDVARNPYASREKREYKVPDPSQLKREEADPQVLAWFAGRGISEKTLQDWTISYGPSFGVPDPEKPGKLLKIDGVSQYTRGIQFPFLEDGNIMNMKYLRPREWAEDGERQFRSFVGGKPIPFGLDRASKMIVIVEGEIDALSVSEAGIPYVWSIPNGAKSFDWLELDPVVSRLLAADFIYLAGDGDADGRACREELIRRLSVMVGPERLSIVNWPAGCKDANDVLVKFGPERLKEIIEDECQPIPIDGISEVDEFIPEYMDYYVEGVPKGLSTGVAMVYPDGKEPYSALDDIYRVMPGMVTVVTGVTNYGKSELMDEIVRCMIQTHDWPFAFYTPENYPLPQHMMKIAEKYIGKPFDKDRLGSMTQTEAQDAAEWMKDSFFYINPRSQPFSVDEILDRAKILVVRKGIKGLIIDPWNYVRKDFGGLREDQYINQEVQKICVFAKSTGVHVWLTVHPRTLKKDKDGNIDVPTVMELSGGSKFGDNADFFFVVHRNPKEAFETGIHKVSFLCQKSRYRPAARIGYVNIEWEPFNGRFKPLGQVTPSVAGVGLDGSHDYKWTAEQGQAAQGSSRPSAALGF